MLTTLQTRWVAAFTSNGFNATAAARTAGYSEWAKTGYQNKRNPKIMTAVAEAIGPGDPRVLALVHKSILDIARNPDHKDHLKACIWLLACAGISPKVKREQKTETIEHRGNALDEVKRLSVRLGIDPRRLISDNR
jgi:hypothetical protein